MGASFHYVAISCYLSYTKRITANSLPTWDLGGKHPNYPCVSAFALRVYPDEGPLTDIYVTEATYICFLKTLNPVPSMFRPRFHVRVKHPCRFFFFVCIIRVSQFGSILHHDLADLSWSVLGWRMPVSEHCNSLEWRGSKRSGSLRRSYEFLAWKGHSDEIWWDGVKRCPDQLWKSRKTYWKAMKTNAKKNNQKENNP